MVLYVDTMRERMSVERIKSTPGGAVAGFSNTKVYESAKGTRNFTPAAVVTHDDFAAVPTKSCGGGRGGGGHRVLPSPTNSPRAQAAAAPNPFGAPMGAPVMQQPMYAAAAAPNPFGGGMPAAQYGAPQQQYGQPAPVVRPPLHPTPLVLALSRVGGVGLSF